MRKRGLDRATFLSGLGVLAVGFACTPIRTVAPAKSGASEANPFGPTADPSVDAWLRINERGEVTILFGKVELGTGVETAISQLAADGLDVPIERVHVVQGDTALTPDQGYTAGSQTLTSGSIPVRQAAHEARRILMDLGARHFDVPTSGITTKAGSVIVSAAPQRSIAYGTLLVGQRLEGKLTGTTPQASARPRGYVGASVPRVDIPAKVFGAFPYLHNMRLPGMMHARVLLPPSPGATFERYDFASVAGIPGFVMVVRRGNVLGVVARDEWGAVQAAQMLGVTWKPGPGLRVYAKLFAAVQAEPGDAQVLATDGDVDAALKNAQRGISARYEWPYQCHGSIGPSCAIADVKPDSAEIWSTTQGVFPLRGAIAQLLKMPATKVRVRYAEGAGCYGQNGADDAAGFAAIFSQTVKAPVRLQYMRGDETGWDPKGPAMVHEMHAGLATDGSIAAWDSRVWSPNHNGRPGGNAGNLLPGILSGIAPPPVVFLGGERNATHNYATPTQRVTIVNQTKAVLRSSALRGLGAPQNTFANESMIDELAHLANSDPFLFRRRHLRHSRELAVLDALRDVWHPDRGVAFVHYENTQAIVAAVADVAVDHLTGVIRVNDLWIAHDCGLVVNPDGLRNQIEGNALQGVSRALKEQVQFDPSRVTSVDWSSYPILTFAEVPEVTIRVIDRPAEKILGAGEATTTVIAPALANAVFAKTGVRLRRVPFTPELVLAALKMKASS